MTDKELVHILLSHLASQPIPLEQADISLLHGYDPVVYIDPIER